VFAKKTIQFSIPMIAALLFLSSCENIENQLVRWTGEQGRTYNISLVNLISNGARYDQLDVFVGGYLGQGFENRSGLYFVTEHVELGELANSVQVSFVGKADSYNSRTCELYGSYLRVTGKFDYSERTIFASEVNIIKASAIAQEPSEC